MVERNTTEVNEKQEQFNKELREFNKSKSESSDVDTLSKVLDVKVLDIQEVIKVAKKKQPQKPLVSSISTVLKKTIRSDTQVCTPEEVVKKKRDMLDIVDNSLKVFSRNLSEGRVDMTTSSDLERLVKLSLLLSGEADSITGKPANQVEENKLDSVEISMSKVEQILSPDDPEVKSLFDKLYNGYNEENDID